MRLLSEPQLPRRIRTKNGKNPAVRGRDKQIFAQGWPAFRVAKKRDNPEHEWQQNPPGPSCEHKEQCVRDSSHGNEWPAGPMNDGRSQIVTCVPISTTLLGGNR